jgi:TonB family protein
MYIHDDEQSSLIPYLIASIVAHILLFAFFPVVIATTPAWKEKVVEVFPVFEKSEPHEIADIPRPAVEKRPKKARFLGMYDSSVDEETVASTRQRGGKDSARQAAKEAAEQHKRETAELKTPDIKNQKEDRLGSLYKFDHKLFAMKTPDVGGGKEGAGPNTALDDYYPDYKLGVRTYLNVLRFPDVEYFVRMKRQFKITFNPEPPLRQYFMNNRVTRGSVEVVLGVSVNRDGNLSELFILNSSGIASYDQESMRTVRASAPFASPPGKFLTDDGLLRMSWTFTVYL